MAQFKTIKTHNGLTIYQGMGFPETLDGLDIEIVKNTLSYMQFIADMSDDYSQTIAEQNAIRDYQKRMNLI